MTDTAEGIAQYSAMVNNDLSENPYRLAAREFEQTCDPKKKKLHFRHFLCLSLLSNT
jgi:hypothetical protein